MIRLKKREILCIVLTSLLILGICSQSSPLFPTNTWDDANIYFTIGRGMRNGLMPYRDLYDHKGPVIYMLHGLAACVSSDSFLGVYLMEVVCMAFFLAFSFKTVKVLRDDEEISPALVPLMCVALCAAKTFWYGDSSEEISLPMIAYALYLSVLILKGREIRQLKLKSAIAGALCALVFFNKYNHCGFYVGWFIVPSVVLLARGEGRKLLEIAGMFIVGFAAATGLLFLYLAVNGIADDTIQVYFADNLKYYGAQNEEAEGKKLWLIQKIFHMVNGVTFMGTHSISVLLGIALVYNALNGRPGMTEHIAAIIAGMMIFVFMGDIGYNYYPQIFYVLLPFAADALMGLVACAKTKTEREKETPAGRRCMAWEVTGFAAALLCCAVIGTQSMGFQDYKTKFNWVRDNQVIAEMIRDYSPDSTLLDYTELDGGFYLAAGILPQQRFFVLNNMRNPEMYAERERYAREALADFVVVRYSNDRFVKAYPEYIEYESTNEYRLLIRRSNLENRH